MTIIFGLGNPGREYENTYHNLGFIAIDELASFLGINLTKKGLKGVYGEGKYNDEKVILVKPQTYMNLSGECVLCFKQKFKDAKIMVFVDDIDLPRGTVRYKKSGSGGTHNGLRNIVLNIGQDFQRIKIGIGRKEGDLANYVLSKIDKSFPMESITKACKLAIENLKQQ